MRTAQQAARGLIVAAAVVLGISGCLWAGGRSVGPQAEAKAPTSLSPDEQAAQALLDRVRREVAVEQQQRRFLAEQHVQAGKAHAANGDWQSALRQFEKAVALDPAHAEAQDQLRKARGLLHLGQGRVGRAMADYRDQRAIAIGARKIELRNLFDEATRLYEQGRYREAIEAFTRVKAKADYLAPYVDASPMAEEAAVRRRKAQEGLERQRDEAAKERQRRARDESRALRDERERLHAARTRARLDHARTLFGERRYEQARALCDEVLRLDPGCASAADLAQRAATARRDAVVRRARAEQPTAVARLWDETRSWACPQAELVHMPRELFDAVRNRRVPTVLGGKQEGPEEWERRIREKLATEKVTFDFVETPLADVLAFLSSLTDVTVVLDQEATREGQPNVTLRVNEMTLERALNWICKLVGLKYTLRDEAIYVASPARLPQRSVLRMYDVTDLTMEIKNFAGKSRALATGSGRGGGDDDDAGRIAEELWDDEDEDEGDDKLTGEKLIEFIRQLIAPGTWRDDDADERPGFIGEPFAALGEGAGDRRGRARSGQELVDVIGLTVGGRTFVGVRTRE